MIIWISFFVIIIIILALDLGVFNKNPHIISSKEATKWTAIWITISFLFSGVIYWIYGNGYIENPDNLKPLAASIKYITGYLIELSLSIDNIFVIAIIFSAFKIPQKYQHRVLFWGILGAVFFRGLMIYFGVLIINKFAWTTYIFGAFLIYTAVKMLLTGDDDQFEPKKSFVYKALKKIMPISNHIDGEHFFVKRRHLTAATPLFVALVVIEVMDVVFAVDSVPAILAITNDPFLVFSSNIFAILGLRSMYFFLANMLEKFSYLEYSLIVILTFVGVKMILQDFIEIPEWVSLAVIALSLLSGVVFSLYKNKAK
ncbi:MAG: TerC family protein [Flavobacteriaceae bacterium]|uniref:TerC family protein n=1 Tax=Flavobacterium kayseriense TaxID=2764714 RepID=A0ABR7J6I8_9FLAO|nr:TerC family protein [Flavobacterium kayseriense]MBC5841154.1 TerC family protein [Flavobacterium kayseriense]MBC5847682.1 TerC family protein [Flavobacterium kayseriense]MBX9887599.1 TerC family protein [Flavobacteriaceae bacterium]